MLYDHQIWWEDSLTKAKYIARVKGQVGVSWGQVGVNLLSNTLRPPHLVGRTPDQSLMHCWGQRSCRGQVGSSRGQFAWQYPMATKFGEKNPWSMCDALLGQRSCRGHPGSTWGQIAKKCPMATKFGGRNPWSKCNALLGSKVVKGSIGVK